MSEAVLRFSAPVELMAAAGADKPATVKIRAYSGSLMQVPSWGLCAVDLAGLDTRGELPLLVDHVNDVDHLAGTVRGTSASGALVVDGVLARSSFAGQRLIGLAKEGVALQASIGVSPTTRLAVRPNESVQVNGRTLSAPGGFTLVQSGRLREISVVPMGADEDTSVSISASAKGYKMDHDILTTERDRVSLINARCDALATGIAGEQLSHRLTELRASAIGEGWLADKLNSELQRLELDAYRMQEFRAAAPKGPSVRASQRGLDGPVLEGMLLAHLGAEQVGVRQLGAETMQRARESRVTNFPDWLRAGLQLNGQTPPREDNDLIRAAFGGGGASIVSLPTMLGNTASKIAMDAYQQAAATWRSFAAVKTASNFKQHVGVRLTMLGSLEELPADGMFRHAGVAESTYFYQVATFGKLISLTRNDIINDDLGMFNDTAQAFGRAAARKLSDLVFKVLLTNGGSFYDAANANYQEGASTALDADSLSAALLLMRGQKDADRAVLDIVPKTLLVPPELESTAKAMLQSDYIQRAATDAGPTGNVHKGALSLEVESRLSNSAFTGYSAKAWYLFASPADAALIVAFLNGQESPTVEFFGLDSDANRLGVAWRVYHDFGAALADPKATVKSKGET